MGGNSTLEEFGKKFPSLQFVVLYHQFAPGSERESHWDLLLEQPYAGCNELLTFEVSAPPQDWGTQTSAKRLHDHRSIYLNYEGPISGNRGFVRRILKGDAQWVTQCENSLVLNLRFRWEKEQHSPLVAATLNLTKASDEEALDWELKLQVCDPFH
jgi:hypothetical protein